MILIPITEGKFIQLHLTFQSNKIELHYAKNKRQLLSLVRYITQKSYPLTEYTDNQTTKIKWTTRTTTPKEYNSLIKD